MKMSLFTDRLVEDLTALAKLGGSDLESAVARLIPTLAPVFRTRLFEAITEVTSELKDQLPGARIEARLTGDEVELVYLHDEAISKEPQGDLNARITLRLPEDLKARIEKAATRDGVSLNSWLLKASERGSFSVQLGNKQLKGKGRS